MTLSPRPVRKRHVFFIPGHDPASGRRYHRIYAEEGPKQAAISDYQITVHDPQATDDRYCWQVTAAIDGATTETTIDFLLWNDLVKQSLSKSVASAYWLMLRTLWIYVTTGVIFAAARVRPVMLIPILYPFGIYLAQPLIGIAIGLAIAWLISLAVPVPWWATLALMALATAAVVAIFRRFYDRRLFTTYLILAYAYIASNRGGPPSGLFQRGEAFVDRIAAALASDVDEVLIVGHSAGAGIGASLCAMLLRGGHVPPGKLALLGIGSVTQMLSFLPRAGWIRANLNQLAKTDHLAWVEVSAPSDGMCFALADPVATSGVDPDPSEKHWPVVFSATYHKTLSAEFRASADYTMFRRHYQYIYAFDQPAGYDYFQITAGPKTLMERYGTRRSTASRITRPASRYRDLGA